MSLENSELWKWCKVIEIQESGSLVLLHENLTQLQSHLFQGEICNTPIVFMSTIGPKSSGKSFITNVLYGYIKTNGKNWARFLYENRFSGFSFWSSSSSNQEFSFTPDENKSGVYLWPELIPFQLGDGTKLVWMIIHVHLTTQDWENGMDQLLNKFILLATSAAVNIVDHKQIQEPVECQESRENCRHVVYLHTSTENVSQLSSDRDNVFELASILPEKQQKDAAQFSSKQHRTIEKLIKKLLDSMYLKPKQFDGKDVTSANLQQFLQSITYVLKDSNRSSQIPESVNEPLEESLKPVKPQKSKRNQANFSAAATRSSEANVKKSEAAKRLGQETKLAEFRSVYNLRSQVKTTKVEENDLTEDIKESVTQMLSRISIWDMLAKTLQTWIESDLQITNIKLIETMFHAFVGDIVLSEIKFQKHQSEDFRQFATQEISTRYFARFREIQNSVENFCLRTNAQFSNSQSYTKKDIKHNLKLNLNKILASVEDSTILDLVAKACNKLEQYYFAINQEARADNEKLFNEISDKIVQFYQEELQAILDKNVYLHPDNLVKIHKSLTTHLEESVVKVTNQNGSDENLRQLKTCLDKEFQEFEKKNFVKIQTAQKEISTLIAKLKSQYEIAMDTLLQDNPKGVNPSTFSTEHDKNKKELIKKFETEASKILHKSENTLVHLNTLKENIEYSCKLFEDENLEYLKEAEKLETKKKSHKSSDRKPVAANSTPLTANLPKATPLHPLLFHLALNKIGIGIQKENTPGICYNYTTAESALTSTNEWLYGENIQEQISSGNEILHQWKLDHCFTIQFQQSGNGIHLWSDIISINGNNVTITTEFLVAMLLQTVKQKYEDELQGHISEILICVPFWFPSFQRQQVADAAELAGFKEVYLYNENTAAAYFMYCSNLHDAKYNTIVISESSRRVDVSLYSYDQGKGKLSMIGHAGDYESSRETISTGWVSSILSWLWSLGQKKAIAEEEMAIKCLASLLTLATNMAESMHYTLTSKTKQVLISCETESWVELLTTVANRATKENVTIQHEAAIHGLAAIYTNLCTNLNTLQNVVRDGMPYFVNVYPPFGEHKTALKKQDSLSLVPKRKLLCKLTNIQGTYLVVEENNSGKVPIGYVILHREKSGYKYIEITLHRNNEGVIWLDKVELTSSGFSGVTKKIKLVANEYQWKSINLTPGIKSIFNDIIQNFVKANSTEIKFEKCRELAIQRIKEIHRAIQNGLGTFPGELVRQLATKQVKDAEMYVTQNAQTEDDIQKRLKVLETISKSYKIC